MPYETAAISAQVLCTPYNHAPCHFIQSHIRQVYVCLSVTCHLHFWQNDRDLLRAIAVTRGWNGYRNRSQIWSVGWLHFVDKKYNNVELSPERYVSPLVFNAQSTSTVISGRSRRGETSALTATNKQYKKLKTETC